MNILHITPHLGGGVGRVLLQWLGRVHATKHGERHTVFSLESMHLSVHERAAALQVPLFDAIGIAQEKIIQAINRADLVIVHWWNHPLLARLLLCTRLPPCRLAIWSHVSGLYPPHIFSQKLLRLPDLFVCSTPCSHEALAITQLSRKVLQDRIRTAFTTAGIEHVVTIKHIPEKKFTIGYVGTVDYCKMHPSFLAMSSAAKLPESHFLVCGGEQHQSIALEAKGMHLEDRFTFTGVVDNVPDYLSRFDVFGYPLRDDHYGTGEQVLVEAMSAGLPVVTFNNRAERALIKQGKTGILVDSPEEYTAALAMLYNNGALRRRLGCAAREEAKRRFSIDNLLEAWQELFTELLYKEKTSHRWPMLVSEDPRGSDLYYEMLGSAGAPFYKSMKSNDEHAFFTAEMQIEHLDGAFSSSTRGSPFHYRTHFGDDPYLNLWCGLLEMNMGNYIAAVNSFRRALPIGHWRVSRYMMTALQKVGKLKEAAYYKMLVEQERPSVFLEQSHENLHCKG